MCPNAHALLSLPPERECPVPPGAYALAAEQLQVVWRVGEAQQQRAHSQTRQRRYNVYGRSTVLGGAASLATIPRRWMRTSTLDADFNL